MDPVNAIVVAAGAAVALAAAAILKRRASQDEARALAALKASQEEGAHLPPSLHPVIDTQVCIGSLSCVSACPEGDILGIVHGAATLVRGASCIGHGRCALECPVDAIKLVFGSSQRGIDLPEVDAHFESSRPGVHIVGELGGMGLIKNAMIQGLQVGTHLAERLERQAPGAESRYDVVVVGAGPAGIAAATALSQAGLRFVLLEQRHTGGAIASYPRQKLVMTEKVEVPGFGSFGARRMTKEALIEGLASIIERFKLPIHEGIHVEGIRGEDGAFVVDTDKGEVHARKVVLAVGRRGTPRRLGVPGEGLEKVTYSLLDPEQYAGQRVMVVGGGDAAVETALSLARAGVETIISYRKPTFNRCRGPNREAIGAAIMNQELLAYTPSEVVRVEPDHVVLQTQRGEEAIPNDYVIVCAGGELPVGFLSRSRISMRRHEGEEAQLSPAAKPRLVGGRFITASEEEERAKTRRLSWALFALGVVTVAALAVKGWDYYVLSEEARWDSPMHDAWRPAGDVGHGIGVVASMVMLSNFLYPMRKRLGFLKGAAPINRWLTFHVFVGLLSPAVIAFHAAFQSNNLIATGTFFSLLVVVGTGLVGRFVYGLVPRADGRVVAREVLEEEMRRLLDRAGTRILRSMNPSALERSVHALEPRFDHKSSVAGLFFRYPAALVAEQFRLWNQRRLYADPADYRDYAETSRLLFRLKFQLELYEALRRFLGWWRILHVTLALLLVVIMGAHIGVALYLGYGWILF
ncbi:MAG: NAD(P)-binding domain-containing protein [Myxococcales bacterium]|nr:NAD(P)-binding domain-containing protein [Myxococcales bacterium]MCB9645438.1 NAD(P)-binding domain-containing protein [Deltaproteobacteria bacterium]